VVTLLNSDDIAQVLTPALCLEALEEAFRDLAEGTAATMLGREIVAARLAHKAFPDVPAGRAYYALEVQTSALPRHRVAALRLKSDVVHWPRLPTGYQRVKVAAAAGDRFCGLILLFDIETGEPLALMPDGLIQRMRVGATSALGAKYLARADARTVGMIGAGWQAGAQLMTLVHVRPVERVRVFSPTRARREAFAAEMSAQLGLPVIPVDSGEAAAEGADILHSATNTRGAATITAAMVRPGMHVGVISVEEIGEDVLARADVRATTRRPRMASSAYAIAGGSAADIREREFEHGWWRDDALWDRFIQLGDLIRGRAQGRRTPEEVTLFHSGGAAIQFAAVGARILAEARRRELGRELPTEWFLQPYRP